jgi:hypothetical protein
VPALSSRKRSSGFIFVFDHEAPGYDIDDAASIAPMICFEAGTVDEKAQGDVDKVASSGCGVPVSPAWITAGTRDQPITPLMHDGIAAHGKHYVNAYEGWGEGRKL